jgi:hypothetical protein
MKTKTELTEKVWTYFNSDLFLVVTTGDLIDVYANDYLVSVLESGELELKDVLFVSECLGDL